MKSLLWFLGLSLTVLSIVWMVGALKAGLFVRNARGLASQVDEHSIEPFSRAKKFVDIAGWRVAYIDRGSGEPIVLLHGCPFQSFEYSRVIPSLARHYRVIAPDLLGLGDTIVRLDDDYRLPNQVRMVVGLLDRLGIDRAHFVGHDHGGAIVQLMMNSHADRLGAVVLTNVEAYDQWPSDPERLDVELIVHPLSTPLFRVAFALPSVQRRVLSIAVHRSDALTEDVIRGLFRPSMATPARWKRLRRFLAWQLDRDHNLETMRAVDGLRRFDHPTLLLWGRHDTNFGPTIAERLAHDIPGVVRIEWLTNSAHLPMLEEPEQYARAIERFLADLSGTNAKVTGTARTRAMRSPISRREFVALSGGVVAGAALTRAASRHDSPSDTVPHFDVPLPIPRVLEPHRTDETTDYYEIAQREERVEILPGRHTTIWGYNGTFPGPTIKARRGRTVVVRHVNRLGTPTAVHLHGGVTPPESDGFPMDHIMPGEAREYVYPNAQRAATVWYHDHAMDRTGRNIYMGLSGLYLLEDDDERSLGLPDGPYDVPLLIQDRLFTSGGSFDYRMVDHLGAKSGTMLVNGAPWPRLNVSTRTYRFRIVNGSNATPLRLALSSGDPLILIATDGGLLPAPVVCRQIPLAMAERVEVIVDFSRHTVGTDIVLQNLNTRGATGSISNEIMQFHVGRVERDSRAIPPRLAEHEPLDRSAAVRTRQFVFSVRPSFGPLPSPSWRINGQRFEPETPIASPRYGDVEIWRFTNRRFLGVLGIVHPVHVHLVTFKVLERNGGPPLPHETGWKDTVAVDRDEDVSVIAKFDGYRGRYLLHCHNLEHEDHAMMARFDVV